MSVANIVVVTICLSLLVLALGGGHMLWLARTRRPVVDAWRRLFRAVFGLALAELLFLLLYPSFLGSSLNLVPGRNLFASANIWTSLENLFGNILLFIPLGVLAPECHRPWRRTSRLLALGLCISVPVEAAQYGLQLGRAADITDVILNVIGILLGGALNRLAVRRFAP